MDVPVPKFSSFRSKTEDRKLSDDSRRRKEDRNERAHPRERRRRSPIYDSEHRHHGRHDSSLYSKEERHSYRSRSTRLPSPNRARHESKMPNDERETDTPAREWFTDRRGDPGILQFGFSDRSKVPKYKTPPAHRCLGLSSRERHELRSEDPFRDYSLSQRFLDQDNSLHPIARRVGDPDRAKDTWENAPDYVPLESSNRPKIHSAPADGLSKHDQDIQDEFVSDSEVSMDSGEGQEIDAELDEQTKLRRRYNEYQNALKSNPENATTWLEFSELQETWAKRGLGTQDSRSRKVSSVTVATMRITVLQDALKSVTDDVGKVQIVQKLLDSFAVTMNSEDLNLKWQSLIHEYPDMLDLRRRYVEHMEAESVSFQFEDCQQQWLQLLKASQNPQETLDHFHAYTVFLWNAGFRELSIAAWQMMLEVFFFRPPRSSGNDSALQQEFEDFWDSESPRVGEARAAGWRNGSNHLPLDIPIEPIFSKRECQASTCQASTSSFLPGKTADEAESDDPYHTILFSDLEPTFDAIIQPFDHHDVVNSFLVFNGLPALGATSAKQQTHISASCIHETSRRAWKSFLSQPLMTKDTLFGRASDTFQHRVKGIGSQAMFVANALQALIFNTPFGEPYVDYFLALLCAISGQDHPTNSTWADLHQRAADVLLEKWPLNTGLQSTVFLIQAIQNTDDSWEDAMILAINESSQSPDTHSRCKISLWRTWLAVSMRPDNGHAELILACMEDEQPQKPAMLSTDHLLRLDETQQRLQQEYFEHYTAGHFEVCIAYVDCLVFLHYLCDVKVASFGHAKRKAPSLPAAFRIYERHLHALSARMTEVQIEYLHQSFAILVTSHVARYSGAMAPADLRGILQHLRSSVRHFPDNEAITEALSVLSPGTERIRSLMPSHGVPDVLQNPQTRAACVSGIRKEMRLTAGAGGNRISVRRAFLRAAEDKFCSRNGYFWLWWLSWEIDVAPERPDPKTGVSKARELWLRMTQVMPGNVTVMLEGLELLRSGIRDHEASQCYDMAIERGLRMAPMQ